MILWFLRLFPTFRALEADHRRQAEEKIRSDDEIRFLREQLSKQNTESKAARREATEASRKLTDFLAQYFMGQKVWGDNPNLPEQNPRPDVIQPRRTQARRVVGQLTQDAIGQLMQYESELGIDAEQVQ